LFVYYIFVPNCIFESFRSCVYLSLVACLLLHFSCTVFNSIRFVSLFSTSRRTSTVFSLAFCGLGQFKVHVFRLYWLNHHRNLGIFGPAPKQPVPWQLIAGNWRSLCLCPALFTSFELAVLCTSLISACNAVNIARFIDVQLSS